MPKREQNELSLCDDSLSFAGLTGESKTLHRLDRGTYKVSDYSRKSDTLYVPLSSRFADQVGERQCILTHSDVCFATIRALHGLLL